MIMQIKLAVEELNQQRAIKRVEKNAVKKALDGTIDKPKEPKDCTVCKAYTMENELLNE